MRPLPQAPVALSVRLQVIALEGESHWLEQTLGDLTACADIPGVEIVVAGSDDQALAETSARAGLDYAALLPPAIDPDAYWTTLLQRLEAGGDYCVLVRAGCRLPAHWLGRLCHVARRTGADALFPVGVRHPLTSAFGAADHDPGLAVEAVDHWMNRHHRGIEFDIPQLAGYCGLLASPWLRPQPTTRHDGQLASAWREAGKRMLVTDAVYIDDSALPPRPLTEDLYPAWREAFTERHPLTAVRHPLTELSARSEPAPSDVPPVRPVRLHITHSWGGGLSRWLEDFIAADDSHHNLVLRPIGHWDAFCQTLALYPSAAMDVPLMTWTLAQPILSSAVRHYEYRQILAQVCESQAVSSIMVSSLIGHSLEALEPGLPITWVCHDFYPICPPLYATWKDPCTSCDSSRLRACLEENPLHTIFRAEPASHWLALRERLLSLVREHGDIRLVAPSRSVLERLCALSPPLSALPARVIEHGLSPDLTDNLARARTRKPAASGRLTIVILGSLADHKGGNLLDPVLDRIVEFADLVLLGTGEEGHRFGRSRGVTVVERYAREELGELLAEHAPDLGLLLSTVPETFSYTLSELRAAGIPVAATNLGAFVDRTKHGHNGWLFHPEPESLLALLEQLRKEPEGIEAVRANLLSEPVRSCAEMVAEYEDLERGRVTLFSPLERPRDPVRSQDIHFVARGNLHINHMATYRQVLGDFLRYTRDKLLNTQRLPLPVRRLLARLLVRSR